MLICMFCRYCTCVKTQTLGGEYNSSCLHTSSTHHTAELSPLPHIRLDLHIRKVIVFFLSPSRQMLRPPQIPPGPLHSPSLPIKYPPQVIQVFYFFYAVWTGKQLMTFERLVVPASSGSSMDNERRQRTWATQCNVFGQWAKATTWATQCNVFDL